MQILSKFSSLPNGYNEHLAIFRNITFLLLPCMSILNTTEIVTANNGKRSNEPCTIDCTTIQLGSTPFEEHILSISFPIGSIPSAISNVIRMVDNDYKKPYKNYEMTRCGNRFVFLLL